MLNLDSFFFKPFEFKCICILCKKTKLESLETVEQITKIHYKKISQAGFVFEPTFLDFV